MCISTILSVTNFSLVLIAPPSRWNISSPTETVTICWQTGSKTFSRFRHRHHLDWNETNTLQVAVYFEPDQSVITKITKDAKMTWSDKISWVRQIIFPFIWELCKAWLPDRWEHGSFHWILSDKFHWATLLDLVQGWNMQQTKLNFHQAWSTTRNEWETSNQVIFHKKDDDSSKEKKEELGWRERRSQQSEDVEITDVNDNDDKASWVCFIWFRRSQLGNLFDLNRNEWNPFFF